MMDKQDRYLTPEELRIQATLRARSEVRAEPDFRGRLKREFVDGTLAEQPLQVTDADSSRLHPWGLVLIPGAVAALLVILLLIQGPTWTLHGVSGVGQIAINELTVTAEDRNGLERSIGPGDRIRIEQGITLDLIVEGSLLFELAEGAQVTLPQRPWRFFKRQLQADLLTGELRVMTGPAFSGQHLQIQTAEGRTELAGTAVSVYKGGDFTCVCVMEGTALIGADDAHMDEVPSGMRKVIFADGRPSLVTEIEPQHKQGLLGFIERNRAVFEAAE